LNPQILDLNTFLAFDFSQCEIRVLAEISNDPLLISQFQSGQDIHCLVGNTLTGWSVERIKKEKNLRKMVKNMVFGVIYGLGRDNLYPYIVMKIREIDGEKADLTGITPERVGKLYDRFFARYTGVAKFIVDSREMVERLGYVETLLEFRREISKEDESRSTYWGNQAINSPVQGTAHQLLLIAMALLHLKPRTFNMLQTPLMEIHDALDFRVKVRDLSEAYRQGKLLLEVAVFDYIRRHFKWRPRVPFLVEASAGFCLGSCVEYTGQPVEEWIVQWRQKHLESEAKSWKELAAKTV
jgi:DNA polymerase-1